MKRQWFLAVVLICSPLGAQEEQSPSADSLLKQWGVDWGIVVVIEPEDHKLPLELARQGRLQVYVQSNSQNKVAALWKAAHQAGCLGTSLFVEHGDLRSLHLADNLADGAVWAAGSAAPPGEEVRRELLRVLHPGAKAIVGKQILDKPRPAGADDWTHPYHGPDNNPLSADRNARAPYLTQFLCEPWYVPMPQVTVSAGGRVFKALGHIALKRREWPWLNTLVAINGYNGTQLWKRKLRPGYMIHRSTLIASPQAVYLADDLSCKLLDAATGRLQGEITIPTDIDADGVWKWMALQDGVLYALIGGKEKRDRVIRGGREQPGWPWSDLGPGYGGEYAWGFGRVLLAIRPQDQKVLWTYRADDPIDSRAICLARGRIFVYSHGRFLAAVDAKTGRQLWKTTDKKTLAAIGQHDRAQTASKGFASTAYAKANQHGIYFAGPQRTRLVSVSAKDGSLMWEYPHGNFQLVLRDDALYAMGRMVTSKKFDYLSGKILADLQCYRGNCTRATGTVDSIFTRGYRHTGTMRLDLSGDYARRIPLMRPACQDGVIVSDGMLYWGPWMCDCNHSLVGMIALASAGDFDFGQKASEADRLQREGDLKAPPVEDHPSDWRHYRGSVDRSAASSITAPNQGELLWRRQSKTKAAATAPTTAGGLVFWSGLDGIVRAADLQSGELRWTAYSGGAVRFPPEIEKGRVFVGSGDGFVYCFEASTGRRLWRFRAAPSQRKINVHGRLLSTWPVGSGVLVHEGVVYAAAGITSYDGTHVFALDAATGKIRWQNNSSGRLVEDQQVTGVSVQGHLLLHKDRLYLAGGNVVSPGMFDLKTGQCLNQLDHEWWNRPADATEQFPSRPQREMFKRSPRGRELFVVDGKVHVFDELLYSPPKYGPSRYFGGHFLQAAREEEEKKADAKKVVIRATTGRIVRLASRPQKSQPLVGVWQNETFQNPLGLALCRNAVVVVGEKRTAGEFVLDVLDRKSGKSTWSAKLPAAPVSWGIAAGRDGRFVVTLEDGQVLCYGSRRAP